MGSYRTDPGIALYLALEDKARRLQGRMQVVGQGQAAPERLHRVTEWPAVDQGGLDRLADYLAAHPDCRLVVVDVLARMRSRTSTRASVYDTDYAAVAALKEVADTYGVAVVVNHHVRKAEADDPLDAVSGSNGISGAADSVAVLKRTRGQADAELFVTGRDIAEITKALKFGKDKGWEALAGPSTDWTLEQTARDVVAFLREHPGEGGKAVALGTRISEATARQTLRRLVERGHLEQRGRGRFYVQGVTSPTSVT